MTWLEIVLTAALILSLAVQIPWLRHYALVLKKIHKVCAKEGRLQSDRHGKFYFYFDDEDRHTLLSRRSLNEAYVRALKIDEAATYNVPELITNFDSVTAAHSAGTWREE